MHIHTEPSNGPRPIMSTTQDRSHTNMASALAQGEYKVIIIGPLAVGKTSLLLQYISNSFEEHVSKFVSEEKKAIIVDDKEIVLDLWDTAGEAPISFSLSHTHTHTLSLASSPSVYGYTCVCLHYPVCTQYVCMFVMYYTAFQ